MKRGGSDYGIILENEVFYGISLGYDFCAEHEWGIKQLQKKLGIDSEKLGVDGRTITTKDESIVFVVEGNKSILITKRWSFEDEELIVEKLLNRGLEIDEYFNSQQTDELKKDLSTAWDGQSFGIFSQDGKKTEYLKELYEAFKINNVVFAFLKTNDNPFKNASLCILIKDKLPQDMIDSMYNYDKLSLNEK